MTLTLKPETLMCMIDDADGPVDFGRVQRRKARRQHRCNECWRAINIGETYVYSTSHFDGKFYTDRQCAHCAAAAEVLTEYCGGFLFRDVGEDLAEHFRQAVPWRIRAGRYAVGIRRKWRRFRSEELMPVPVASAK